MAFQPGEFINATAEVYETEWDLDPEQVAIVQNASQTLRWAWTFRKMRSDCFTWYEMQYGNIIVNDFSLRACIRKASEYER